MPVLYIVGTPIGNLGDITFRAVETLKNADVIACEDTRHTLQLLTHFEIRKPLISCRAQNESIAAQKIISLLEDGKKYFQIISMIPIMVFQKALDQDVFI